MMREDTLKLKKGGLDTIIAYIVVMLPLLYVLIYMVATIYHYSVQTYMDQVVKEAAVMASTYGTLTTEHRDYIQGKLANVLEEDENGQICTVEYYRKAFDENTGIVDPEFDNGSPYATPPTNVIDKADIIGIYVESTKESLLGSVSSFSVFGNSATGGSGLKYTSYREEIIRNENPEK